jgi:myo-inositol 2-dehydrogenase/D-chiro-inositol 1-dehydrogenase
MIGFNRRFDPSFKALRERLQGGEIGRLELAVITSRDPAPPPATYIKSSGDIDTCTVSLRAKSGALVQINNSRRCAYGYDQRIEAFGSSSLLQAGNQYATSVESWGAERTAARDPVLNFFIERYRQAYESEVNSFVASLEEGRPMSPDFADGLEALQLAVAAEESLQTGRVVDVGR